MAIFLCGDLAAFLALFAAYIYLRHAAPSWPVPLHFPSSLMGASMTMFALAASVTMAVASRSASKGDFDVAQRWIALTIGGWLLFAFLGAMEWVRLVLLENIAPRSLFGEVFFALCGFHMLHVLAGLVLLLVVAVSVTRRDLGAWALYVHFTNLLWLFIFFGLYLTSADLKGL